MMMMIDDEGVSKSCKLRISEFTDNSNYRVSFYTGPAQRNSKYGTGPAQQRKIT